MKKYFALSSLALFIILGFAADLTLLESLSIALFLFAFLELLLDLGERIVIMDFAVQAAIFTCLVMPVIFYHVYTKDNYFARIWVKYMPISSDEYFSFAIPAVVAMAIGLRIPLKNRNMPRDPGIYMQQVKAYLSKKPNLGLALIATGVISGLLNFLAPAELKQVFYLMEHLTYVGVFYVIYSPYKQKSLIVAGVITLMIGQTLAAGMFGEFIYLLACSLTLILLGKRVSFRAKLGYALLGVFFILLIQSIKMDYRQRSWNEGEGSDPLYFAELVGDRISDLNTLMNPDNLFFTSVRMNQGWLVALTMKLVPDRYPFAGGETIAKSVAATIVPRFLWPDKPEAGGKANLKRFWGYNLVGYSMNIGPLGEAYANFNKFGGVVYMFFYGLFFNFMFSSILKFAKKKPTIVLWLPFLFFYSLSVETDLLTTMGSLIKGIFFTWIIFQVYRVAFRMDL